MAEIVISDRFAEQCSVVSRTNYDTCGTFTRSSLKYLTPAELEALYVTDGAWHEMDAMFKHSIEMKACGTPVVSLYDWIMGNTRNGKGSLWHSQKISQSVSLMNPYILGRQSSVLNTEYWYIETGGAQSGYTAESTGPLTSGDLSEGVAGDRWIRVKTRYGVDMDAKLFNPRTHIHILSRSASFVEVGMWKVLASALADDGSYVDVLVESMNAGSSAPFDATPTAGLITIGTNNVNDYEKWCYNLPNWDPKKYVPFWIQTMRYARCVDSEYMKAFARLRNGGNEAFRAFGDLDLAERNRQDEMTRKKRFVWDFFLNKPISAAQTLGTWMLPENGGGLEDIVTPSGFSVDPGTGGKVMGKRANFIGIVEQLRACDRVKDLTGAPLNLRELLDEIYRIKRAREANGKKVTDIDIWTDSVMAVRLHTAFLQYWKDESLQMGSINIEAPKPGENAELGIAWTSYRVLRPSGVRINVLVDNFFDDFRDANAAESQEAVGSVMAILDLGGSIYWAPIKSNRKVFTVGKIQDLARIDKDWKCVMESVEQEQTLISETGTAIVECPQESLWIWGIGDAAVVTSGQTADEGNLY